MMPHLPLLPWPTTYGVLVATAFVVAWLVVRRLGPRFGLPPGHAEGEITLACLVGLVGARVLLVVVEPETLWERPLDLLTHAGVFYGGFVAAAAFVIWRSARRGEDPHLLGDVAAPALGLAHAVGRLACFAAGCCWGRACEGPLGVAVPSPDSVVLGAMPGLAGVPLHPVQLYEAAGTLLLGALAWAVLRRRRFVGQAFWTYVGGYALLRLVTETFRGDPRGTVLGGRLSTSQGIAVLALVAAVLASAWRARAAARAPGAGLPAAARAEPPSP